MIVHAHRTGVKYRVATMKPMPAASTKNGIRWLKIVSIHFERGPILVAFSSNTNNRLYGVLSRIPGVPYKCYFLKTRVVTIGLYLYMIISVLGCC